jgi:hypothetical protein
VLKEIGVGSGSFHAEVPSVSLSATDVIGYRRLSAIVQRVELDLALEYMRSDERYGLLTSQHTEKAEKCDRGRCRRPHLDEPIDDSDCNTQDKRSQIRPHRMLLASKYQRDHQPDERALQPNSQSDDSIDLHQTGGLQFVSPARMPLLSFCEGAEASP